MNFVSPITLSASLINQNRERETILRGAPRESNQKKDHMGQTFQSFEQTIILKILSYPHQQGLLFQRKSYAFSTKLEGNQQEIKDQQEILRLIPIQRMEMPRMQGPQHCVAYQLPWLQPLL